MSNQSQLAKATIQYCADNSGRLMPVNRSEAYKGNDPIDSFFMHYTEKNNHGYLYTEGYVAAYETFYCPAIPESEHHIRPAAASSPQEGIRDIFTLKYYEELLGDYPTAQELPNMAANFNGRVRSSYYFNPQGQRKTYKLLQEMESSAILFSDLLMNNFISHSQLGNRWLVAKGDGGVKAINSPKIKQMLFSGSDYHFVWGNFNQLMDELLDAAN